MRLALLSLFIVLLFGTPCPAKDPFRLAGDWKGECINAHDPQNGFHKGDSCLFSIKEERDGVFYGQRIWQNDSGRHAKKFSGVLDPGNHSIRITEGGGTLFLGSVNAPNEIELHQLQTQGPPSAARYLLHRVD